MASTGSYSTPARISGAMSPMNAGPAFFACRFCSNWAREMGCQPPADLPRHSPRPPALVLKKGNIACSSRHSGTLRPTTKKTPQPQTRQQNGIPAYHPSEAWTCLALSVSMSSNRGIWAERTDSRTPWRRILRRHEEFLERPCRTNLLRSYGNRAILVPKGVLALCIEHLDGEVALRSPWP